MSKINKSEIPQYHCHKEVVYQRINKKLGVNFLYEEIEALIKRVASETTLNCFLKKKVEITIFQVRKIIVELQSIQLLLE